MSIAIVTGASSGLGKVFFEKVVERYPQLDEIWIIARRESMLKELAGREHGSRHRQDRRTKDRNHEAEDCRVGGEIIKKHITDLTFGE